MILPALLLAFAPDSPDRAQGDRLAGSVPRSDGDGPNIPVTLLLMR